MRGIRLKPTEVPFKVVRFVEPKLLSGSDQNGKWSGAGASAFPCHGCCTTGPEAQPSPRLVMKVNE
jgi:hypothetical protein